MHSITLGTTLSVLAATLLSFFSSPAQAGLNNHGSSMCYGHHNQLQSLIRQLEVAPFRDVTIFSGSGKRQSVGCITFSNLNAVAFVFGAGMGSVFYLGTALLNPGANGQGALCAFYQGTRGASFSLQRSIDQLKTLATVGNANPCGSIPINWPYNNDTGGELTMNYVDGAPCDGFCVGNRDLALPPTQALKNDPKYDYAPGTCTAHLTWYQRTKDIPSYYFDVSIRDANRILVREIYYVEAKPFTPISVGSPKLPCALQVTAQSDTLPLKMEYDGKSWDTGMEQCACDKEFVDGFKACDCKFTCGQALGLVILH